jgi:hypothetical protein
MPAGQQPTMFGLPALALLDRGDEGEEWMLGGPADLPRDRWRWSVYHPVTDDRRRLAQAVLQVARAEASLPRSVILPRSIGVATSLGRFLLAGDERSLYLLGYAAPSVAEPPALHAYEALWQAAQWLRQHATALVEQA